MQKARIYQPARTAMQSGRAQTKLWVLEWPPAKPMPVDPLMGWTGMQDTTRELRLEFSSREEAIEYAKKQSLDYDLCLPHSTKSKPKVYADNFRFDRVKI